jgi:hypothetical protein
MGEIRRDDMMTWRKKRKAKRDEREAEKKRRDAAAHQYRCEQIAQSREDMKNLTCPIARGRCKVEQCVHFCAGWQAMKLYATPPHTLRYAKKARCKLWDEEK